MIFLRKNFGICKRFYKNFIKNKRAANSFINLRNVLELNFNKDEEFSFIQVGANDGVSFDYLYDFVTTRNSSGVVIEPVLDYFNELIYNYKEFPKIVEVNKAVHPFFKSMKIYKIKESSKNRYPEWVKGIASFDPIHHRKTNISGEDIEEELVVTDTLMNIIADCYVSKKVDYLQIDTEGFDFEVLKMINFDVIKPTIIKYELVNLSNEGKVNSKKLLMSKGYSLFEELNDAVAINLSQIKYIR